MLPAAEAESIGLVDRVAESFDDELARLSLLDPAVVRTMKELSRHADALSATDLRLVGERLGEVYFR